LTVEIIVLFLSFTDWVAVIVFGRKPDIDEVISTSQI